MNGIVAYGDSIMKGIVREEGKLKICPRRFTTLLEEYYHIPVENLAHFGHTITRGAGIIERSQDKISHGVYDTVLMEFGGNDCDFDWRSVSDTPNAYHSPHTEPEEFVRTYEKLIYRLQEEGQTVKIMTLPPINARKYYQYICRMLENYGIQIFNWLNGDIHFLSQWHDSYNFELFRIAQKTGTQLIDITTPFLREKNGLRFLCEDGIHPNEKGHRLIADAVIDAMGSNTETR